MQNYKEKQPTYNFLMFLFLILVVVLLVNGGYKRV